MSSVDLAKLEKNVRNLANAGAGLFAMLRQHLRGAWLKRMVQELYASTLPSAVEAMGDAEANQMRETLRRMQGDLSKIAKAIPFDKKLPAHLRPLTTTFQNIFMLSNATAAGIAALTLKLEGEIAVDLSELRISESERIAVREYMHIYAPGWEDKEMGLYDQL